MSVNYKEEYNISLSGVQLLDQLPSHVYVFDKNNNIIWVNEKQCQKLNHNKPNIIGTNIASVLSKKDAQLICQNNELVISSESAQTFNELITIAGSEHYYHSHKSPFYDLDGNLFGVIGVSHDITDLAIDAVDVDQPMTESMDNITNILNTFTGMQWVPGSLVRRCIGSIRSYFEVILGVMPGSFYWFDKSNKLLGCNKNQAEVFGKSNYIDLIGKSPYEMVPPDQAGVIIHNNNQVMHDGKEIEIIEDVSSSSGQTMKMLSTKKPIFDKAGNVSGLVGVSLDITELQSMQDELKIAVEKAEAANNAKTDFLLNISHDIRTPCSGLLGFAKILRSEESDPEKCEKLGYIENSAEKLLAILNQLIDYVRNENSPIGIITVFNLKEIISGIETMLGASLHENKLSFSLLYPNNIAEYWRGDAVNLERVLLNLITNAVKFTDQGGVSVIVSAAKSGSLQIDIKDTGCGINKKDFSKIFDTFQRLTPSYEGKVEGMGLGLSLVKNIIDKLGGSIAVASVIGSGSTFTVELPFLPAQKPDVKLNSTQNIEQQPDVKFDYKNNPTANNVLIIEDDDISRKINRIILEKNGFNVTDCATAEDAQQQAGPFDLVITDIGLPGISGFDFSRLYRAESENLTTFIVGLSAHLGLDYLQSAKKVGMNKIITKPLTDEVLSDL
jgi:two-component system, OmpR family, aerobic respiration control sensor histidine kinase ArcB